MKKDKGFTLTEILVVIILLGVVATISIPTVKSIIEKNRKKTFQESIKGIIRSTELYISSEAIATDFSYNYNDQEHIKTEKNHFTSGRVKYKDGVITISNFSDGNYCANGTSNNLTITKGECESAIILTEDNDGDSDVSIGDKVCIDTECFYVVSTNDDEVVMLSEWNLNVGYDFFYNGNDEIPGNAMSSEPDFQFDNGAVILDFGTTYQRINTSSTTYNRQDSSKRGIVINGSIDDLSSTVITMKGIINFVEYNNSNAYWLDDSGNILPQYSSRYVYNENSNLYQYVENYKNYLEELGASIISARLLTREETELFGCSSIYDGCLNAPSWFYQTSYWIGSGGYDGYVDAIILFNALYESESYDVYMFGLRPVIVIPTEDIQ